jgi:hypothetical protein
VSEASATFDGLARELADGFAEGVAAPWGEERFGDLALRVFAYQFEANHAYGAFARGRGITPTDLKDWRGIPPVPTTAFKHLPLVAGDPARVERVFRTSGTSRGRSDRGEHHVLSLDLYRASALPNLRAHLLPEGGRIRILSLIPSADAQPHSSLSTMMDFAVRDLGAPGSAGFAHPERGVDHEAFGAALRRAVDEATPVLVAGTAFAFVHWLDEVRERAWQVRLPAGSRIMETGGFKGRSREVPRDVLYRELELRTGIPSARMVNEYGMTELLSQFYEPVLLEGAGSPRRHRGPPWVRTRVLHPETLEEVADGEPGLLCHLDLANLGSVAAVLTEDLGVRWRDGFEVLGRAPGAEPRGCSLALEDLLAAGHR